MARPASPCRRAIIHNGQVVGWETYQAPRPDQAKILAWAKSPAGHVARARKLEINLCPMTMTQSVWEAEEIYGRHLYPAWTPGRGYHWKLEPIE